jgi:hypothetical protein
MQCLAGHSRKKGAALDLKESYVSLIILTSGGRTAEIGAQYCKEGKPLMVEGRLQLDSWVGFSAFIIGGTIGFGVEVFVAATAQTLIIIHNFVDGKRSPSASIDCLEKHRSPVRTKYRLEAYATLRRCHVAAGTRKRLQEDFHTSRASPESKVA